MSLQVIYLANGHEPDSAIQRGLAQAGCEVTRTNSVGETLERLPRIEGGNVADGAEAKPTIIVAELQDGALALLSILRERMRGHVSRDAMPPMLVFDREGKDIYAPIKALRLGAQEYLLASDPEIDREFSAQYLVERVMSDHEHQDLPQHLSHVIVARSQTRAAETVSARPKIEWEPIGRVIRVEGKYIHLSPIEGRMFNLLLQNVGHTVTLQDFMRHALNKPDMTIQEAVQQLRPHMMRLRRKLAVQPDLASRIVNTRGTGYILTA